MNTWGEVSTDQAGPEDRLALWADALWHLFGCHGRPEGIAQAVLCLASDQCSFTIGAMPMADGGMSA